MKFAIKGGNRVSAELSGDVAKCYCCNSPVRAYIKNGERQIRSRDFNSHWKHINKPMCDKWWENETDWHRTWKNNFPEDWQEFVRFDILTAEKHIADVYTIGRKEEIVIEFQNSKISEQEVISREMFYKKMIWVVNARGFGITIRDCADIKNEGTELLKEYNDLKVFISSFYDRYSGEAASYIAGTVPFKSINFNDCIRIIEWYTKNYSQSDLLFQEEFRKFKNAILEYPKIDQRFVEYENRIKKNGYFYYNCNKGLNFWSIATAPVFFDIDGDLYKVIQNDKTVNETNDYELGGDDEWEDDGWEDDIVKRYSYMQFIKHYKN
ncbi:MAG: hypothetical protein V4608_09195 [Bacteroidota bacterium]